MLTDIGLQKLKPEERLYKRGDRDGMYVAVLPSGTLSFRYNYRLNGRGKTLVIGRYETARLPEERPVSSPRSNTAWMCHWLRFGRCWPARGVTLSKACRRRTGRLTSGPSSVRTVLAPVPLRWLGRRPA